jgi:hypothetical protein
MGAILELREFVMVQALAEPSSSSQPPRDSMGPKVLSQAAGALHVSRAARGPFLVQALSAQGHDSPEFQIGAAR